MARKTLSHELHDLLFKHNLLLLTMDSLLVY